MAGLRKLIKQGSAVADPFIFIFHFVFVILVKRDSDVSKTLSGETTGGL